jgi:peptidyl-prolyl cis-trans isomerase D
MKIDDATAQEQFDTHKDLYSVPERRKVQQLVFSDKETAEKALSALNKDSASFDDYVKKQSSSTPSDLGIVAMGDLPMPEMDKAVFAAKEGALTDVFQTPFGYSILRVASIYPSRQQQFNEVKDQIKGAMKRDMAESVFEDTLERLHDMIAGASALKDVTTNKRITLQSFDKVSAAGETMQGKKIDVPGGQQLLSAVFTAEEGTISDEVRVGEDKIAFIEVTNTIPSRVKTMDEIRDELVSIYKQRFTESKMMAKAKMLLIERNRGQAFEQISSAHNLAEPLQTMPALKRADAQRNNLVTEEIRKAIFAEPFKKGAVSVLGTPYKTADGNIALFEVTGVDVAAPSKEQMAKFAATVNQAIAQDLFSQFAQNLNNTAKLDIRTKMIDAALSDAN